MDIRRILILFAHPAFERSRVNRLFVEDLDQVPGVTFHDLYETYPDWDIDVPAEQALLLEHDVVVFQHPLFWFSTPAILKEWQDLVLQHGWAYGSTGNALVGKVFFSAVTAGGGRESYSDSGFHGMTLKQSLAPISYTATFCNMRVLPPFAVHGTLAISDAEILESRRQYHHLLGMLREDTLDLGLAESLAYLNDYPFDREGATPHE